MNRGRSPSTFLWVLLGLGVLAAGSVLLLRDGARPEEGPAPVSGPEGDLAPLAPAMGAPQIPRPAEVPREAIAAADEGPIPLPAEWPGIPLVKIEGSSDVMEVSGETLRTALLATPLIYVRWSSEAVRDAFLKAKFTLRGEMNVPRDNPRGAPIPVVMGSIMEAGFAAEFDPPVLRIAEGKPGSSPRQPPR